MKTDLKFNICICRHATWAVWWPPHTAFGLCVTPVQLRFYVIFKKKEKLLVFFFFVLRENVKSLCFVLQSPLACWDLEKFSVPSATSWAESCALNYLTARSIRCIYFILRGSFRGVHSPIRSVKLKLCGGRMDICRMKCYRIPTRCLAAS